MNDIKHIRVNIDNVLANVQSNLNPFILDTEIKNVLRDHADIENHQDYEQLLSIAQMMSNMVDSSNWLDSMYIYDINDNLLINSSTSIITNTDFSRSIIFTEIVDNNRTLEWIPNKRNQPPFTIIKDGLVTFGMPITVYTEGLDVGYVFLNVNELDLFEFMQQMDPYFPEEFFIANNNGEIVSHKDKNLLGKKIENLLERYGNSVVFSISEKRRFNEDSVYILSQDSKHTSLTYYSIVPLKFFSSQINSLKHTALLFCAVVIVIVIILTLRLTRGFYIPIDRLVEALKELTIGTEQEIKITEKRKDEFGILYDYYNKTVDRLHNVFDRLMAEQLKTKEAEIKFLQAQINPHLLYNTLNSIYCISRIYEIEDIMKLSSSLSSFFRLSLSEGSDRVPLKNIIEHIRLYVQIQNIRLDNRIKLNVEIDESLSDLKILKLLHQPIVENCITHGLKETGEELLIDFKCIRRDGKLLFNIEDNGKGVDPEKLDNINHKLQNNDRETFGNYQDFFALHNINERIHLYYGKSYGISLSNRKEGGARVNMVLPSRPE
jgi:two-component system sensor histidine kinase YesM